MRVRLPVRKFYHIIKVVLCISLLASVFSLFEYWRSSSKNFVVDGGDYDSILELQIRADEAKVVPGLGEGGVAVLLTGADLRRGQESEKKNAMNVFLSDKISLNRTLKDFRHPWCGGVVYERELPSVSVVVVFHNEPLSALLRTVWSVLNSVRRDLPWYKDTLGYPGQDKNSTYVFLKEIILVDDNSTLPELKDKLGYYIKTRFPSLVKIIRLPDRLGLTRARMSGARVSSGSHLVFLDAHCEVLADWLRPLLARAAVTTPLIDMIDERNFQYLHGGYKHFEVLSGVGLTRARLSGARAAGGQALVFLDAHCEVCRDWLRPLLSRLRSRKGAVSMPIIDAIDSWGLMSARSEGARAARGSALLFLDAHCEAGRDWLRPLLSRLRAKGDAVLTPLIDVLHATDLSVEPAHLQVGGFTFAGHFTWIEVPEREKKRRGSDISPTWSPTMAGGLFAISRAYFWQLGAYDEQMAGWGGENLELSFRIWQCGGSLETVPCSRVGHVFRDFHPYGLPAHSDTHGINTARMAEVWMDEYKELFYLHRPDLRNSSKIGDVTHRRVLRQKLRCRPFSWYLRHVYPDKFVPTRAAAYGRFQNPASGLCLDSLQREGDAPLGKFPCHPRLLPPQYWSLSRQGQLRGEESCAQRDTHRRLEEEGSREEGRVMLLPCREKLRAQRWRLLPPGLLQHRESGQCLSARGEGALLGTEPCAPADLLQLWRMDYSQDPRYRINSSRPLTEQELALQKLRDIDYPQT